jgi:hypothetical protein
MKAFVVCILMLNISVAALGQRSCVLFNVRHDVTYQSIDSVDVRLFRGDSIPVEARLIHRGQGAYALDFAYAADFYSIVISKRGYEDKNLTFQMKSRRHSSMDLGYVYMEKVRHQQLGTAVVRATHIKMVMKGDTIVYDAAAFELAEGSMLDALIAQLPNTRLENGRITVNGQFIESLLLNGKDFFSGNPQVALENLPAYTVKNIKVYDKTDDDTYLKGKGERAAYENRHRVMDVTLKKKYTAGWLGNVEGGWGLPQNKYLGRAFALGYTDHFRLTAYGNLNNIKNTQTGNSMGEWNEGWAQNGDFDIKMGGVDYYYEKDKLRLTGNLMTAREDIDEWTKKSVVSFYDSGDIYSRYDNRAKNLRRRYSLTQGLQHSAQRVYTQIQMEIDYHRDKLNNNIRNAEFTENPLERYRSEALDSLFAPDGMSSVFTDHLLSRFKQSVEGIREQLITSLQARSTVSLPKLGDYMQFDGDVRYEHNGNSPFMTYQRVTGPRGSTRLEVENIRQKLHFKENKLHYTVSGAYHLQYKPYQTGPSSQWELIPQITYRGSYNDEANVLYELREKYEESALMYQLLLPSVFGSEQMGVNLNNTYNSVLTSNSYTPSLGFRYSYKPNQYAKKEYAVTLVVADELQQEQLQYDKHGLDTVVNRFTNKFLPEFVFRFNNRGDRSVCDLRLRYSFKEVVPSIHYQLGIIRDSDPMNIYYSNPNLKKSLCHNIYLDWLQFNNRNHHVLNVNASYDRADRSLAMARYYDRTTGISTWMPENVNGNWQSSLYLGYSMPLGKKESFQFQTLTKGVFMHSVDYASETEQKVRSVVNNTELSERLNLSYRVKKHSFAVHTGIKWLHSRSKRTYFENADAFDVTLGLQGILNFRYNWQLENQLNMTNRSGYNDDTFNTTHWVWNSSLAKSFLKGNLTLKFSAVDILKQISSVYYTVNAQGRTETWVNSLPRYVMLHILYKLHVR